MRARFYGQLENPMKFLLLLEENMFSYYCKILFARFA